MSHPPDTRFHRTKYTDGPDHGTAAKYATGRGNAPKQLVVSEISARTGRTFPDDNQVDAWILRAMALDAYGFPCIDVPKSHRDALNGLTWPQIGTIR